MKLGLIIAGIVVVILIAAPIVIFAVASPQDLQKAANLATIVTSVFACGLLISITALVAAVVVLISVIANLTSTKVGPLIDKVNETADTARGTAAYIGEGVVSPLVKVAGILAAVRAAVAALFRAR